MGRILSLSLLLCLLLSLLGAPALADDVLRIPTGTTAIEAEAFFGDTSLGEVVLPEGIKTIGANAFAGSTVTKINLPKSLVSIDNSALPAPGTVEVTASAGSDAYTWAVGKGYIVPGSVPVNASTFPDPYFRNYVTNSFDTNRDGFLSEAECAVVTTLELMHKGIETLKGVENFPNLYQLRCFDNAITELDLSRNTGLVTLDCAENPLTALNVSGCTNLGGLYCQKTQLTALDVRGCANLAYLWCYQSRLGSLNVSGCGNLEELLCQHNALTELDLNGCRAITTLNCSANAALSTLTLSGCAALTTLDCVSCDLGALTLTDCVNLKNLNCRENRLTALDVSGLSELQTLYCTSNGMTSLDVLGCAALGELDCAGNALEELELDTLTGLVALTCAANPLEELDILTCTGLRQLFCYDTDLTALDISGSEALCTAYHEGTVTEDENSVLYLYEDGTTVYRLELPKTTAVSAEAEEESGFFDEERSLGIFEIVNQRRAENNVPALDYCYELQEAADLRARECVESFSHTRPDGSSCFTVISGPYWTMGENIAARYVTMASPAEFMSAWMNSDGHRGNILNASYTDVAVGIYFDNQTGYVYATQLFVGRW